MAPETQTVDIIKFEKAKFEKNKLTISDTITIDEWKDLGQCLKQVEGSVQFWIGDWARFGEKKGFTGKYVDSKVYDELEEITGIDRRTIQDYKTVADRIPSAGRHADLSFSHHREAAGLPEEKQQQFLNKAADENQSVRELRQEIRKEAFKEKVVMPSNKYKVLYVDPPWQYNDKQDIESLGGAQKHYPTMTIDELCQMPLPEVEDNAVLFMWVTSPLLEESFDVVNAWGFKYKTSFIWDKVGHNMGHYNSVRHEILLVCTRGSCTPENVKLYDSVQTFEKTDKHSEKPEVFRKIIEDIYPSGNRIELFARVKTESWDTYGNEI